MKIRVLCLIISLMLTINCFAAIVSDNDGSAFVTKSEFEALKKDFSDQVANYNSSIDSKIDGAIASYLAGINISKVTPFEPFYAVRNDTSTGKLTYNVLSINKGSLKKTKQYQNAYSVFVSKWNGRGSWGSTTTTLKPYGHTVATARGWYVATITLAKKFNDTSDIQSVWVTSKDHPTWVKNRYELGYLTCSGGVAYVQLWIGSQQVWWIASDVFDGKKINGLISSFSIGGINSNSYSDSSKTIQLGLIQQDTRYNISSGNSLVWRSDMYFNVPGSALIVTKTEKNEDKSIYLYNEVDDNIVMYNEADEYLEEYTETAYTSSDKLTVTQEVLHSVAGTRQASGTGDSATNYKYGYEMDTAWPRFRIQQRQNGRDASNNYIRYDNLSQLKNGRLEYDDIENDATAAPGFAGGLPLFSFDKSADVNFKIKIVNDASSGLTGLSTVRVWVSKGEFLNKKISNYTESERKNLVKIGSNDYIDINIGETKKISLKDIERKKTYFLKFGDPTQEYGGKIELLDDFDYVYVD